jgi:putative ABC transport system permease protein
MRRDLRYAARNLRRTPVFTGVALVSLAVGIGANTAVFSIADQVLLRTLSVAHADDLVFFTTPGPMSAFGWGENRFSYPMFREFRDNPAGLDSVAARFSTPLSLTYNGRSERIQAELVSGTWFQTLGLGTALGRGLTPADDRVPGGQSVVVLTYDCWRSRFGGDRAIVDKVVQLNGHPMQVIGVAARGYRGFEAAERTDVLVPTMMKAAMTPTWNGLEDRGTLWLQVVGRLRDGVTAEEAGRRLEPFYRGLLRIEADVRPGESRRRTEEFAAKQLVLVPAARGGSDLRNALGAPLRILGALAALLLAIACANVANLLLARSVARRKEIAIRLAVGASRVRLMRQLLVESVMLAAIGAGAGLIVAAWTASGLVSLLSASGETTLNAGFDAPVFAFAVALALLTSVVFGAAPAWHATSPEVAGILKDQGGSLAASRGQVRARKALVIAQVAISLVLLIGAGLFTRSLRNLNRVDLGFRRESLITFSMEPSLNGYSAERIRRLAESLAEKLGGMPGAVSAAVGSNPVISDNVDAKTVKLDGRRTAEDEDLNPYTDAVTPGYFATLGIPLLAGRDFTERDRLGAPRVAIVNDVFARKYFEGSSPVGRRFGFGGDRADAIEIVGEVRSSKYSQIEEKPHAVVYTPLLQEVNPRLLAAYLRTASAPRGLLPQTRRTVSQVDPALAITNPRTMDEQVAEALAAQRVMATLSAWFAGAATLLAAIGLYGVMAYVVSRRAREMGIRSALGADRGTLLGLVLREAGLMTAVGVGVAIPVALGLTRLVRSQLYEVAPWDPVSVAGSAAIVAAVALAAGYAPAARATRVSAAAALREE